MKEIWCGVEAGNDIRERTERHGSRATERR